MKLPTVSGKSFFCSFFVVVVYVLFIIIRTFNIFIINFPRLRLCVNKEGKGMMITSCCDVCVCVCVCVCVWVCMGVLVGANTPGDNIMMLLGGVFVDVCWIFFPTPSAGISLSPWQVDARLGTKTWLFDFHLNICLFFGEFETGAEHMSLETKSRNWLFGFSVGIV